ncbi:MAG: hypothetical protein PGN12_13390 [Sphingomonas phyllosphaerae]
MTSLSPLAGAGSTIRSLPIARPAAAPATPATAVVPVAAKEPGSTSTGSLIRTASEQLDQFDRVMEKLKAGMAAGAVTYGGGPPAGQTGQIVDRLG